MPATTYWANLICDAAANGTAFQGPATIYLALVTDTPSATTAGTEVDDDDYERSEFAQTGWTDDGAGTRENTAAVTWPEAAEDFSADIEAIEAYDAATAGNRLWYQILSAPVTILAGEVPTFDPTELTFSIV